MEKRIKNENKARKRLDKVGEERNEKEYLKQTKGWKEVRDKKNKKIKRRKR